MEELKKYLIDEFNRPLPGWNSNIEKRIKTEPLTWDYKKFVLEAKDGCSSLLDMGTGDGKLLSELQPFPKVTYATEAHEPNIEAARKRLEPLGVRVIAIKNEKELPFDNEKFDLITNRHESYYPSELKRILKNDGIFITQQVGGKNNIDLNIVLGAEPIIGETPVGWHLRNAVLNLEKHGFEIETQYEQKPITRFYDISAIIFYLKTIPWQIVDFSINKYYERLENLNRIIIEKGCFECKSHRFFIKARKI